MTWFNAPLYNAGLTFPSMPREYVPSVEGTVTNFLAAGIPAGKLGIGVPFFGKVWRGGAGTSTGGVTAPVQEWTQPPVVSPVSYNDLLSSNFAASFYHYDAKAQAAYFSITNVEAANNLFISFEDPRACAAKAAYVRHRGLGGMILWELGQDHRMDQPDSLLLAIKQTLQAPGLLSMEHAGPTSNPPPETSLSATNFGITYTGGVSRTDESSSEKERFYQGEAP